jgi:hypothetical protein
MGDVVEFPKRASPAALSMMREVEWELQGMTLAEVRALWDQYDGTNEPDGYTGENIHKELNRRGDGRYCAV